MPIDEDARAFSTERDWHIITKDELNRTEPENIAEAMLQSPLLSRRIVGKCAEI